jgi:hypothetical protein
MKSSLPVDPARIRTISGSFSWIDHRFIPMTEALTRDENLLYLWLVAVGDRRGVSFYSDEKTASRIKLVVHEIVIARRGLIAKGLIAWRDGISQVLALPTGNMPTKIPSAERNDHVLERPCNPRPLPPGCHETFAPPDCPADRQVAKAHLQDLLRRLEGAADPARFPARPAS